MPVWSHCERSFRRPISRVLWRAALVAIALFPRGLPGSPGTPARSGEASGSGILRPENLRCEYLVDPIGLDAPRPRFSWTLRSDRRAELQTAYRLLVASKPELLEEGRADIWDSRKVETDRTCQVVYGGPPLRSRQLCYWSVRAWDSQGRPSPYGGPARFEMGILSPEDWKARWIARTRETEYAPAPHFRKEFEVRGKPRRARLSASGLGYQDLYVNGARVGDRFLDPGYTRYDKRVLYATHDVTSLLRQGKNALGAVLGTGWYNVHARAVWGFDRAPWRASPRVLLSLWIEYEDGSTGIVGTDGTWKTSTGPIIFDGIYGGETYDARLEKPGWNLPGYDDSGWEPALEVEPPKGRLVAQSMHPIRITETISPVRVAEPKPGVFVYDFGQNLAGVAQLRIAGPRGTSIKLEYGERLAADGTVDRAAIAQHMVQTDPPQRFQTDVYILRGEGEEVWEARFAYHGFQYVQVTGAPGKLSPANLSARFAHSDVPRAGRFECSNELLNAIARNARWSYLSNLHGVPTDCPHREKNGWTGDAHLAAEQGLYTFDSITVYAKWIADLDDEQRKEDEGKRHKGELPGIVPTSGWGYDWGNGPAWDSALLLIPWYLYERYGDTRILETHYESFKLYVDYLTRRAEGGIVSIGLGDWSPAKTETPVEVTSTGYYYRDACILSRAARILGKENDARAYAALAERVREAFLKKFCDLERGTCSNSSQTALGCALYQGLVPAAQAPKFVERLVQAIEGNQGLLDFGILGSKYVLRALTEGGRADVAYRLASERRYPSWGHWIDQGATTLWESWAGHDSRNHIMFGDIVAWFYSTLAGIAPDAEAPGFRHFFVKPHPLGDLRWVRAEHDSIRGRIAVEWRKGEGVFRLRVHVPAGAEATVFVPSAPAAEILEGRRPAREAEGVVPLGRRDAWAAFRVGSGDYDFEAPE